MPSVYFVHSRLEAPRPAPAEINFLFPQLLTVIIAAKKLYLPHVTTPVPMRTPSSPQSVARYPLSAILASEGSVRVLRELARHGGELNAPVIASHVRMSPQQVRQILGALQDLGMVEGVGTGRYLSYRMRRTHPLYDALDALFRAEEERFDAILEAIRSAASSVSPTPRAVWLYGSVARGEDMAHSDVDVALVVDETGSDSASAAVREVLREAEERLGVHFSVIGISPTDVLRLSAGDPWWTNVSSDAIPLVGPDPEALARRLRREREKGHGERRAG